MVHEIRPSRREFLATGAATTAGLLLGHQQKTQAATAEPDGATVTGLPTGFRHLDLLTGGLHRRELVLLASRASAGKTSLALNITDFVAVEACMPTLYVSLGTSRHDITQRLLCARGEVSHAAMQHRKLPPEVALRLTQAGAQLSNAPLYLDDQPLRTVSEIGETLERVNDRLAPGLTVGLLVVDHLQRVEAEYTGHTESEHLIDVAYGLREMAIRKDLAVLALMQLSCLPPVGQQVRPAVAWVYWYCDHAICAAFQSGGPSFTPIPANTNNPRQVTSTGWVNARMSVTTATAAAGTPHPYTVGLSCSSALSILSSS